VIIRCDHVYQRCAPEGTSVSVLDVEDHSEDISDLCEGHGADTSAHVLHACPRDRPNMLALSSRRLVEPGRLAGICSHLRPYGRITVARGTTYITLGSESRTLCAVARISADRIACMWQACCRSSPNIT